MRASGSAPARARAPGPARVATTAPAAAGHAGQLVLEVVHVGQVRRQLGQLVERGDADPLEEVAGRAVQVRAGLAVLAGLLDQAAGQQGAHHAVDVHAADRGHPGPGHRLLVGHDGEGLQRRLGEPRLLPVEHEALDDGGVLLARVVAPAAGDVAQLEAAALLGVLAGQLRERVRRPRRPGSRPPEASVTSSSGWSATISTASSDGPQRRHGDVERLRRRGRRRSRSVTPGLLGCRSSSSRCSVRRPYVRRLGRGAVELVGDRRPRRRRHRSTGRSARRAASPGRSRRHPRGTARAATGTAPPWSACPGESPHSARNVIVPLRRSRSTTRAACSRTLTLAAWMCCSDTSSTGLGSSAFAASRANWSSPIPISTSGSSAANRSSSPTARGCRVDSPASRSLEHRGDLLERAVLQQPGEQQVAGLQQREVLLVLDVALRQQPGGLEVEQRRGDQQERRRLLEVPDLAAGLDVRDELVGDLRQRHLGDVELVLGDQAEQQVERALEVVEPDLERGRRLATGHLEAVAAVGSFLGQPPHERAVVAVGLEVGQHERQRLAHHAGPGRRPGRGSGAAPAGRARGRAARRR